MGEGIALALITAVLWGIVPIMEKVGLEVKASPFNLAILRSITVGMFALVLSFFSGFYSEIQTVPVKKGILIASSGIIAGFIAMTVYYSALKRIGASVVVPLASTYPLFALIFSIILLHEKVTFTRAAGAALVVTGVILISSGK